MLGRLPRKYQVTIWVVGLLTSTAVGASLVSATDVPLVWPSGAALGALLGALAVVAFQQAIGRAEPARRSVQVHRQGTMVRDR